MNISKTYSRKLLDKIIDNEYSEYSDDEVFAALDRLEELDARDRDFIDGLKNS